MTTNRKPTSDTPAVDDVLETIQAGDIPTPEQAQAVVDESTAAVDAATAQLATRVEAESLAALPPTGLEVLDRELEDLLAQTPFSLDEIAALQAAGEDLSLDDAQRDAFLKAATAFRGIGATLLSVQAAVTALVLAVEDSTGLDETQISEITVTSRGAVRVIGMDRSSRRRDVEPFKRAEVPA